MDPMEVIDIWRTLKGYIPPKDQQAAAEQLVSVVLDFGFEEDELHILADADQFLENAVKDHLGEQEEYEDDEDDDEWDIR